MATLLHALKSLKNDFKRTLPQHLVAQGPQIFAPFDDS